VRIAIQGEPGSNSHLATEALLGPQTLVPCTLSPQVFQALADLHVDAAVLPIENSLHGAVADHYDLLLQHDVTIAGEVALRIRHALIAAPGASFHTIRQVFSHPVALSQCRKFFAENPQLQAVPFYDTAGAARHAILSGDPTIAAIAAPAAAQVYTGTILRHDLEDDPQNFTRFFLLARPSHALAVRASALHLSPPDRLSIAFAIPHQPGSLVVALQALADLGADLTRIESRPVPGTPWEYVFFIDLRVPHPNLANAALHALQSRCTWVRSLGHYGTSATHLDPVHSNDPATAGR
jgi:prephenate dehydratase